MTRPLTGIAIIRCQLSEKVCPPEEWKKRINDNPDFRDFCIKTEEIVVIFMDCKGCQKNKDEAGEIKDITTQLIENGVGTIFLTRCMCRNIKELKTYIGIKDGNLNWINTFASFCKDCIGGLKKESKKEPCALYEGRIIKKCPNKTAYRLLGLIKDNYPWVNVVIKE